MQIIGTGSVLRTAVIFFYLSNEGVSLLENAAHLGLPVPMKLKKGYYIGAFALFGYHKVPDDKHKLIIDEEAADIVRRIFSLKIEGNTTGKIAIILNAEGVLTPGQYKERIL